MSYVGPAASGEIFDLTTQTPATTDPTVLTLSQAGVLDQITHAPGASEITILLGGLYLVIVDCHVQRTSGGADEQIDIWAQINGAGLLASRTRRVMDTNNVIDEIGFHRLNTFQEGDVLEIVAQVSTIANGIGVVSVPAAGPVPAIPSVNVKLIRVGGQPPSSP